MCPLCPAIFKGKKKKKIKLKVIIRTRFGYKPFAITHYVAAYKIIHVLFKEVT